jgi:hypothetical protein
MTDELPPQPPAQVVYELRKRRDWDALAAVIAACVGLLALCVSGYTAYIQRQQVRAQVWPYLEAGNYDDDQSFIVENKGVGPALVRSAQIFIDGKPQPDWSHVLETVGLDPHHFSQSTLNPSVLTPTQQLKAIKFSSPENATEQDKQSQKSRWEKFRLEAEKRMTIDICFCSTLDECWLYSDKHPIGYKEYTQLVKPVEQCPQIPINEMFIN